MANNRVVKLVDISKVIQLKISSSSVVTWQPVSEYALVLSLTTLKSAPIKVVISLGDYNPKDQTLTAPLSLLLLFRWVRVCVVDGIIELESSSFFIW